MRTKQFIYIACFELCLSACNLLGPVSDINPNYVQTDENVIEDANSAEYLLNGIYSLYRKSEFTAMRNAMPLMSGTLKTSDVDGMQDFIDNTLKPANHTVLNYYVSLYGIINQANSLISKLEGSSPKGLTLQRKSEILGETYFHKAFAELMLLRAYGEFWDKTSSYGIVLYNEPVRDNSQAKARSSVNDCYTQILGDLDKAIQAPVYNTKTYRISQITVKALRSRVMLYMNQFKEASKLAKDVIDEMQAAGTTLESQYTDIFANGFLSTEILFAPFVQAPLECVETSFIDMAQRGFGNTVTLIADELVGTKGDNLMDPRYKEVFLNENGKFDLKKYVLKTDNNNDNNTYYFMRLAEIYLIRAEAEARQKNYSEARNALKAVTDRAGYDVSYTSKIADKDLLLTIFRHKYIELSAENYEEWYDMVRYNKLDGIDFSSNGLNYTQSMKNLNLPIPEQAIGGNRLLKQNPTYSN